MINPKDAASHLDKEHAAALQGAEAIVDKILASKYHTGGSVSIGSNDLGNLDYHLRLLLFKRYQDAGWAVKTTSDQREQQTYYTFTSRQDA